MLDTPSSTGPTPPVEANAINMETQSAPDNEQLQTPAAQPAPQPQIQQVPVPFVPPHVSRMAGIGHIASSLLGNQYQYSIDPKTGQQVQTPIPNKPGSLFRQMVVGALLGGAAAEGAGDPTTGFFKGGAAGAQNTMQQDQLRRQQAQEQFRNQVLANRENRENAESDERVKASQAQTALHNVQKIHENQLIQGTDLAMHEQTADIGKAKVQAYIDSGVKPTFRDQSETQMNELQKQNQEYKNLDWEPTGVSFTTDKDGHPSYELTYSGYSKNNPVKITQNVVDALQKQGMERFDPEGFAAMQRKAKSGETMDARDFATTNMRAQGFYNNDLKNLKEQAQIDEAKAGQGEKIAMAAKAWAEQGEVKAGKTKANAYNKAIDNLNKVGDFDKLPLGDQQLISEGTKPQLDSAEKTYTAAANAAAKSDDPADKAVARDAYQKWKALSDLNNGLLKITSTPKAAPAGSEEADKAATRASALFQSNPNSADAFQYVQKQVQSKSITQEEGQHIMAEYMKLIKAPKPAAPSLPTVNSPAPTGNEIAPPL